MQSIKTSLVKKLKNSTLGNDCEIIWAKLGIIGSKTLYISYFYNRKTSDEKSFKSFDISVRRASQIKIAALFIGGDFNLPG